MPTIHRLLVDVDTGFGMTFIRYLTRASYVCGQFVCTCGADGYTFGGTAMPVERNEEEDEEDEE